MVLLDRHSSAGVFDVKRTQRWRADSRQSGVGVVSCGGTQVADEGMKGRLRGRKLLLASVYEVRRRLSALEVFLRDSDFFFCLLFLLPFPRFWTFKGLFLKNKLTPKCVQLPPPLCVMTIIMAVMIMKSAQS